MIFQVTRDAGLLQQAARLRYDVFVTEQKWLKPNRKRIDADRWDAISDHIVACDEEDNVLGVMRVIHHSTMGYPFEGSYSSSLVVPEKGCEISRLAVAPIARDGTSLMLLCMGRYVWRIGMERSLTYWCALTDVSVVRLLRRLGFQFEYVGDPVYHVGSDCQFVICTMEETHRVLFSPKVNRMARAHVERELAFVSA